MLLFRYNSKDRLLLVLDKLSNFQFFYSVIINVGKDNIIQLFGLFIFSPNLNDHNRRS